ncbi:regulatory protein, luxR family [Pseudonocardia thermophila]|jgi:Response regulator containing a CheY-like receiver domain and an HTH DNA-binding domain|uniref:Regulatory protein, luxR family n=1 Tax=Pseudonocardia thermophila TaxID=1848 RepID=A0A1M6TYL6_PSETH|nr:helix-turn-helix transcriptional regulator [Pseudonocardia thermophila]SHK62122.1 regulatory protein, luxR family [Pseudonocardia thermophila]
MSVESIATTHPAEPQSPEAAAAAALAPMVEVWFQMLVDHVPDADRNCTACTHGGTGARHTPWPCALRTVAEAARQEFTQVSVPSPRKPLDDTIGRPAGRRRRLRSPHGVTRMLTAREQEYLQLAADGYDDARIAAELGVPERTVATSIRRLARTLGVPDRTALLVLALREGVIA